MIVSLLSLLLESVHENSPQKRNSGGQKCPGEFTNLSTKIPLLCQRELDIFVGSNLKSFNCHG
jgi:hypothetical protein